MISSGGSWVSFMRLSLNARTVIVSDRVVDMCRSRANQHEMIDANVSRVQRITYVGDDRRAFVCESESSSGLCRERLLQFSCSSARNPFCSQDVTSFGQRNCELRTSCDQPDHRGYRAEHRIYIAVWRLKIQTVVFNLHRKEGECR